MEESVSVNYIYHYYQDYGLLISYAYYDWMPGKIYRETQLPADSRIRSDPELRHWGGPPAVNGEKDKTQPKTKMNDHIHELNEL